MQEVTEETHRLTPEPEAGAADASDESAEVWKVPPAQPLRLIAAVLLLAVGAFSYGYALANFWSSPALGIHCEIPYPAYVLIALGLMLGLLAVKVALRLWSPHARLAIAGLAFLASVTFAIGGGRFVSYTIRGTRNPPYHLQLSLGGKFPDFKLADQNGAVHDAGIFQSAPVTLVMIYRGDFCPFARFELNELSRNRDRLARAGIGVVAISADPRARSVMLARFLNTPLPLLSDPGESLLSRLGLVQHYANHQPDSAIPAFFLVDRRQRVRWIFSSRYYRVQPSLRTLLDAASTVRN